LFGFYGAFCGLLAALVGEFGRQWQGPGDLIGTVGAFEDQGQVRGVLRLYRGRRPDLGEVLGGWRAFGWYVVWGPAGGPGGWTGERCRVCRHGRRGLAVGGTTAAARRVRLWDRH